MKNMTFYMCNNEYPKVEQLVEIHERYSLAISEQEACGDEAVASQTPARIGNAQPEAKSAWEQLMEMTGLEGVKEIIAKQLSYHRIMNVRRSAGLKAPKRLLHMLLIGNPGTGKTTVARLIGDIYKQSGLLSSGHIVETNRAGLVGQFIGQSEKFTTEKLQMASGGILYIDEIYSLVDGGGTDNADGRDFGLRVIDTLMPIISNPDSDVMVIGAGYPENIKFFLKANPGLASRFPLVLEFPDFTLEELMGIAHKHLEKYDFRLSEEAELKLRRLIEQVHAGKNNGNARQVITIIENHLIPNFCLRIDTAGSIASLSKDEMGLIIPDDVPDFNAVVSSFLQEKRISIGFNR